jgi:hypothetical protein
MQGRWRCGIPGSDMRQLVVQMIDLLGVLSQAAGTASEMKELETIAIFCGVGLDASLWCIANGWG